MKKLLVLMLALVMALSLAACGGSQPASASPSQSSSQEAVFSEEQKALAKDFSEVIDAFNKIADRVNASPELLSDEELVTTMNEISAGITEADGHFTSPEMLTPEIMAGLKEVIEATQEFVNVADSALNEIEAAKAASVTVPVEIFNLIGADIHALALSPANDSNWGENLISDVIKNGEKVEGELVFTEETLVWDILVQDGNGNQLTFMGVDFSEASADGAKLVLEATEGGDYFASVN